MEKKLLDIVTDNLKMVNKLTHISGSLIDHRKDINLYQEKFDGRKFHSCNC